jgi:hypothetical protein
MALTNTEKRVLLVSLRFMYYSGATFVAMLVDGESELKQKSWKDCRAIIKKLHKQIKATIDDNKDDKPKAS